MKKATTQATAIRESVKAHSVRSASRTVAGRRSYRQSSIGPATRTESHRELATYFAEIRDGEDGQPFVQRIHGRKASALTTPDHPPRLEPRPFIPLAAAKRFRVCPAAVDGPDLDVVKLEWTVGEEDLYSRAGAQREANRQLAAVSVDRLGQQRQIAIVELGQPPTDGADIIQVQIYDRRCIGVEKRIRDYPVRIVEIVKGSKVRNRSMVRGQKVRSTAKQNR